MAEINIRKAELRDIVAIEHIQQHALAVLVNPEALDPVPIDELKEEIKAGLMAVAEIDGEVGAFRTMHIPTDDYLGPYAGIDDAEAAGLIYSDITIVDPDYRGLSLQRKLGEWLFNEVEINYKRIMATVHPDNTPSLKDKFHLGMHIIAMDRLYGGKLRFIFMKDLTQKYDVLDVVEVEREELEQIQVLLDQGYRGVGLDANKLQLGKFDTTTYV
ncbi:N-acetyltransferase [Macrococcoides goetzii]|uniref:N-acetyltransferase n=1 Tax=Macrococcoides goetzii TaxID=1891097 RepID=A0A395G7D1_9STAP|nr:GNAT family protein [Macrococcus goetzii]RAI79906.1 N-acetyltransferase [Macrococcus goetzii]